MVQLATFLAAAFIIPSVFGSTLPTPLFTLASSPGFDVDPSKLPSQCKTTCQVLTDISQCSSVDCVCSSTVSDEVATCISCVVKYDKSTTEAAGQTSVDQYINECNKMGATLTPPIIETSDASNLLRRWDAITVVGLAVVLLS